MSTISTVGTTSAWPESIGSGGARASKRAERMFEKVDSNGDGSVDSTELQSMLDDIAKKTGGTAASAADTMSKLDTDGNGSLSKDELAAGMKDLMPPPSSTMDFAQRSGGMEGPPPPPPADAGTGTSSSSTASTDPLDTNGDGVVSPEEAAAGALKELMSAIDGNSDGKIDKTEMSTFEKNLAAAVSGNTAAASSASASGTSSASSASSSGDDSNASSTSQDDSTAAALTALINMVLKQYNANTASTANVTTEQALSVTA